MNARRLSNLISNRELRRREAERAKRLRRLDAEPAGRLSMTKARPVGRVASRFDAVIFEAPSQHDHGFVVFGD
jgi:hypothetical protein